METENFGACVVLTLLPNSLPDTVVGGQHITLAYFGNNPLMPEHHAALLDITATIAEEFDGTGELRTQGLAYFGPTEDAVVLTMEDNLESEAVIMRNHLLELLPPGLMEIFKEAETFPKYRPHMTLGYISEGYSDESVDIPTMLHISSIAVWNGDSRVSFKLNASLEHYGILKKSGRYPWGSGANPFQRSRSFMGMYEDLQKQGLTEKEIAEGLGLNTRELRAHKTIAKAEIRKNDEAMAFKLKEKGMSNVAIGDRMGINESSVRSLLNPTTAARRSRLDSTVQMLKDEMSDGSFLDIGEGSEHYLNLGISRTMFKTAITILQDEGYQVQYVKTRQLGTGKDTSVLVLTDGETSYSDLLKRQDNIKTIGAHTSDGGLTYNKPHPPKSVDSKRVEVRYGPDGGAAMDGVIELRRGVKDLDMGNARYAQVRIAVDDTHYLKGMAIYSDDLPDGVDIRFNTNKKDSGNKLRAMKPMSDDPNNPWGAVIKANGQRGSLNIVNEEGDWHEWSRHLSSQMLSKQNPELARKQLDLTYDIKKSEFDEIMSLTNPTVRAHLLEKFSNGVDSSAVFLKAKGLPGTQNHVILPITNMKPTEIYAPQYNNGERVVLIRHPHGGVFEIPELTVNNKNRQAKEIIGQAVDAVGIHPSVASQLSGADFDGDTVLVIPNKKGKTSIRTAAPLKDLKNFEPQVQYGHTSVREVTNPVTGKKSKYYSRNGVEFKGMENTQTEMGLISNLITDMTIQAASDSEIARAVKHSMVVIDAEKHGLNYKQSAIDNGIAELKRKYQASSRGGATTIISRAKSQAIVPERKEGYKIDPATGRKIYTPTGKEYVNRAGEVVQKTQKSTKMAETEDAFTLVSKNGGTPIEKVYATHANKLKALGNQARKELLMTPPLAYSPTAFKAYAPQVQSLNAKLNVAQKNAPLERKAQLLANAIVKQKKQANPSMDRDSFKKEEQKALAEARARTGAGKQRIQITDLEWEAIQAGAISNNKLKSILNNANLDDVKKLATPRSSTGVSAAMLARAKAMMAAGYTQNEIASALGISKSTINSALSAN